MLDNTLIDSTNFIGCCECQNKATKKLSETLFGKPIGKGLGITNLRKLEHEFENFNLKEMYFILPFFPADDLIVGIATVNNKMAFCTRYSEKEIGLEKVDKIVKRAVSYMLL